ncbi:secretion-regulating guanine nucleotide exchange factor isoform X2 [Rhineura floridana]|uniref:secretion-regulating guanine nucleotide exchange factor isoform X2 n=1 Tax=Rhineura floridana TaxID=261503 RepID=UPI002AC887D1|nr:secretion-regulating guanine nucleotide exchange factor isoform X2 [Rhineura floridana]
MDAIREETTQALFAWGANSYGQLGLGHKEDVLVPQALREFPCSQKNIKSITGGGGHSAVLTDTGELFLCGQNKDGQLGLSHTEDVKHFTLCTSLSDCPAVQVACGWDFTIILAGNGQVLSCGSNSFGQLGVPNISGGNAVPQIIKTLQDNVVNVAAGLRHALAVTGLENIKVKSITSGSYHVTSLTDEGEIYVWGSNKHKQLVCKDDFLLKPQKIETHYFFGEKVRRVWNGWTHMVAQTETGKVYTWGRGDYGQLGWSGMLHKEKQQDGKRSTEHCLKQPIEAPVRVPSLTGASEIACGSEHNLAIVGNQCFSWGWNEHGMCGDGAQANVCLPQPLGALSSTKLLLIGCGAGHSMAFCHLPRLNFLQ